MKVIIAGLSLVLPLSVHAAVAVDKIAVDAIIGNGQSVSFSSDVFLSAASSFTLRGSGGFIKSASSVTAASFFGDGGGLTGIAQLNSTQTFLGGTTFASSFTITSGGRQISFSTASTVINLKIASDGSAVFAPPIHSSSFTTIPAYTTDVSSLGACVPGSTLTITTGGGRVEIIFSGRLTAGADPVVSFLQDGQFVRDLAYNAGLSTVSIGQNGGTLGQSGFVYLVDSPAAGLHSYCLTLANLGLFYGNVSIVSDERIESTFYVKEIR